MTREDAKEVFLNRGYIKVDGGTLYSPDKWREACVVISDWLGQEPCDDLCKSCDTKGCIFQSGIKRKKCDFYTPKKSGVSDEQIRTVIDVFTCEDAISRAYIEPLVEELENICINGDEHVLDILSNIKNAPSVTPQPKMGKWIKTGDILTDRKGHIIHQVICSECSGIAYFRKAFGQYIGATVCPNCATKMGVVEENG